MEFLRTLFAGGVGDTEIWAPFVLRVGLGLALLTHGYPKFKTLGQLSGYLTSLKVPAPRWFALLVAAVETLGSLMLIAGLFVKPAALILALYFILVMLIAHRGQKFQGGWELPFLYFVGTLALWAMNSSGVFALEAFLNP